MLIACIRELAAQIFVFKYWTKADPMLSPPEAVGLTQPEVNERRQQGQVNLVEKFTTRTVSGILRNNIVTVFNGILTASVAALLAVGANSDAVFLSIVTFANILVGVISEFRAKWALDRLALLQRHVVTVRRDGHDQEIPSDEVVKDDLVRLTPGDQVVADGMFASSAPVVMDESLLTGEAAAVEKRAGDAVLSGSYCVSRAGYYVATRVGAASSVNTLTAQAKAYKIQLTPTQKSINTLVKTLTAILILVRRLIAHGGLHQALTIEGDYPVAGHGDQGLGAGGAGPDFHAGVRDGRVARGQAACPGAKARHGRVVRPPDGAVLGQNGHSRHQSLAI